MSSIPVGKGLYIWPLSQIESGNPAAIVTAAVSAKLNHVAIKIADGPNRFNAIPAMADVVAGLKGAGIQVWGWSYIYAIQPEAEAERAISECARLGLDGYIIDAEVEYKNKSAQAKRFVDRLKYLGTNMPIGLSTYRFPNYHPEFPWREFLSVCDFVYPQVYWEQAYDSASQLRRSHAEYKAIAPNLPFIPVGSAYASKSWKATPKQIEDFIDAALDLNLLGVSFWEWWNIKKYVPELWPVIAAHSEWSTPTPPPPTPLPADIGELLEKIYLGIDDITGIVEAITQEISAQTKSIEQILAVVVNPEPPQPPPPPPGPQPDPVQPKTRKALIVRSPKANVHVIVGQNKSGIPIIAPKEPRVSYDFNTVVEVLAEKVNVDGPIDAWEVYDSTGGRSERWFLREVDVNLLAQ